MAASIVIPALIAIGTVAAYEASVGGRRVRVAADVMFCRRGAAKPPVDRGLETIAYLDEIVRTPAESAAAVRGDDEHVQSVL